MCLPLQACWARESSLTLQAKVPLLSLRPLRHAWFMARLCTTASVHPTIQALLTRQWTGHLAS